MWFYEFNPWIYGFFLHCLQWIALQITHRLASQDVQCTSTLARRRRNSPKPTSLPITSGTPNYKCEYRVNIVSLYFPSPWAASIAQRLHVAKSSQSPFFDASLRLRSKVWSSKGVVVAMFFLLGLWLAEAACWHVVCVPRVSPVFLSHPFLGPCHRMSPTTPSSLCVWWTTNGRWATHLYSSSTCRMTHRSAQVPKHSRRRHITLNRLPSAANARQRRPASFPACCSTAPGYATLSARQEARRSRSQPAGVRFTSCAKRCPRPTLAARMHPMEPWRRRSSRSPCSISVHQPTSRRWAFEVEILIEKQDIDVLLSCDSLYHDHHVPSPHNSIGQSYMRSKSEFKVLIKAEITFLCLANSKTH